MGASQRAACQREGLTLEELLRNNSVVRKNQPGAGRPAPRGRQHRITFGLVPQFYRLAAVRAQSEGRSIAKTIERIVEQFFGGPTQTPTGPRMVQPSTAPESWSPSQPPVALKVDAVSSALAIAVSIPSSKSVNPIAAQREVAAAAEPPDPEAEVRRAWWKYMHGGGLKPTMPRPRGS